MISNPVTSLFSHNNIKDGLELHQNVDLKQSDINTRNTDRYEHYKQS